MSQGWVARATVVVAVVLLASSLTTSASAQPSAADKEAARRHMAEGREKRSANDLKGALESFSAADGIMHVPTTGLEVARALAQLGQLVEARDRAEKVAHTEPEKGEPAPFTRAREEARELSAELSRRIPTVTVQVQGAEATESPSVTVDGAPLPAASMGTPRPLNPGRHVIVASSGSKQGRAEVDLAEEQHRDVPLELKADAPRAEAPAPHGNVGKPLMIGGIVVGGVGLVVGSVAGIVSMSKTSGIKAGCTNSVCPPTQSSAIDSAKTTATVSNVGFVVGGIGAVAAVIGYVVWRNEEAAAAKTAARLEPWRVQPWVGVGCAGLNGAF